MRVLLIGMLVGCVNNDDVPPPRIADVQPRAAPAGAVVTITGSGFCQEPMTEEPPPCAPGAVDFDTVPGTIATWDDATITVEVPSAATGGLSIVVTENGRSSNGIAFTVD